MIISYLLDLDIFEAGDNVGIEILRPLDLVHELSGNSVDRYSSGGTIVFGDDGGPVVRDLAYGIADVD